MNLRWGLGAIAALAFAGSASAQNYNQAIVFGDSNVDSGFYRGLPNPNNNNNQAQIDAWAAAIATGAGAPTTNPGTGSPGVMNSQVLAGFFGLTANPANTPGGTNYATSGAKDDSINGTTNGGFRGAVPTTTQISNYLSSTGGIANPKALYLVDSGSNDVTFAIGGTGNGPFPTDPNAYLSTAAGKLADSIKSLQSGGARYIIVPDTAFSFPTNDPTAQTEKKFYSTTLWSDLAARGVNFIPADFNSVRLAIAANKSAFGFTNIGTGAGQTACAKPDQTQFPFITTAWSLWCSPTSPVSKLTPGADKFDLFADDQHLSAAGQKIEADYYYSLLTAPSEISMLAETAVKTRMQVTADIQTQIDLSQSHRGPQGVNAWVSGDINSLTIDNYHGMANDSNTFGSVAGGVDYRFAPGLIAGVAFSSGRLQSSLGEFGNFKQNEQSFSLYAAYNGGPLWGNVIGTFGHLDYDSNRITPIGITMQSNHGTTTGENWSAAVQGGYKFLSGGLTHGPVVGFLHQDLTVDGFTESGSFTSLAFGGQTRESSVAQLGYRASLDWSRYHPFAQVLWNHEFEGDRNVTASLTTITAPSFSLPAVVLGKDWGSAAAGLTIDVGSGVNVVGKATADFGQSSTVVYGGQLGLNVAF